MVPGTASNAAVALPWLRTLSARWATTVVDLPGQPGLSDPRRPRRARLDWCGRVLDEILAIVEADVAVAMREPLLRRPLAARGADQLRHLRLHQLLHHPGKRLAQKVDALTLEQVADDLLSRHPLRLGHRGDSSRRTSLA
jgi:hypothetical protein